MVLTHSRTDFFVCLFPILGKRVNMSSFYKGQLHSIKQKQKYIVAIV